MDPEEFLRRFSVAVRSRGLYSPAHPIVKRSTAALIAALPTRATAASALIVGFLDGEVVLNDYRLPKANTNLKALVRDMRGHGIEKITFAPGVQETDVSALLEELTNQDAERPIAERLSGRGVTRIIVGKLALEEGASEPASVVTSSEVYSQAAVVSASLWDQAKAGQEVDAAHARAIVDGLYHVVRQDPASFMAITAITRHDQSIFTHMVNVAGLSMALARSLNLDGALLRELGLAALMHDIGKVNTPAEILNKNDKLTKQEGELLKRHVVDGAHILRRTQDMPALASIVAFEHHLGMDFSGYPENLPPRTLNLCTMIVMVVDAFDALRRERQYRDSLATDRVKAMMRRQDDARLNRVLLRRFVNMIGLFPIGSLVRLNTEGLAVVTRQNPDDPFRPQVKFIGEPGSATGQENVLSNTWERDDKGEFPLAIVEAVDPEKIGLDPLVFLENAGDTSC